MLALPHGKLPHEALYRDFFRAAGGAGAALDAILRPCEIRKRFYLALDDCKNVDACGTRGCASATVCAGSFCSCNRNNRIQMSTHCLNVLLFQPDFLYPFFKVFIAGRGVIAVDGKPLGDFRIGAEPRDVPQRTRKAAAAVGDERADGLA